MFPITFAQWDVTALSQPRLPRVVNWWWILTGVFRERLGKCCNPRNLLSCFLFLQCYKLNYVLFSTRTGCSTISQNYNVEEKSSHTTDNPTFRRNWKALILQDSPESMEQCVWLVFSQPVLICGSCFVYPVFDWQVAWVSYQTPFQFSYVSNQPHL